MKKFVLFLCIASLFCACNEEIDQQDQLQQAALQEFTQPQQDEDTSVSEEMAAHVAGLFLNGGAEGRSAVKSSSGVQRSSASVKTVKDSVGTPLMHVLNYPEGGFVIVSATKGYTPVLAYSDKNSFELTENIEDMGPVAMWLEETKYAIRERAALPDSSKAAIRAMWNEYYPPSETTDAPSMLKAYDPLLDEVRGERISELYSIYGHDWYEITTLAGARKYFDDPASWVSLCNFANSEGSPPEYTIFIHKTENVRNTVGPLLITQWGQEAPYNAQVPGGHDAGCAPIAMSQVMYYHQHPQSFSWNGTTFYWSNIIPEPFNDTSWGNDELVRLVGEMANTHYSFIGSWTLPGDLADGLRNMGYNVSRSSFNANTVRNELLYDSRPVIMGGGTNPLPNPLNYLGKGHFWVCDGADYFSTEESFFMELLNMNNYTYHSHPYVYNPSNPMWISGYSTLKFHMNWGWDGDYDAWYAPNNVNPSGTNYQDGREDFYISTP